MAFGGLWKTKPPIIWHQLCQIKVEFKGVKPSRGQAMLHVQRQLDLGPLLGISSGLLEALDIHVALPQQVLGPLVSLGST